MTLFDLARRNVTRHWLRSTLAVVGVVIGVLAIASLGIMGTSIGLMLDDMISDVGDTVIVSAAMGVSGGKLTERQVSDITRAVGSNAVVPYSYTFEKISVGDKESAVMLYAIPAEDIPSLLEVKSGGYPKDTGAELKSKIDKALKDMIADGTYGKIYKKWFKTKVDEETLGKLGNR